MYLKLSKRDERKETLVKRVHGDIWLLREHIKQHIKENEKGIFRKNPGIQVQELHTHLKVRGDYVNRIKQFMEQKGF